MLPEDAFSAVELGERHMIRAVQLAKLSSKSIARRLAPLIRMLVIISDRPWNCTLGASLFAGVQVSAKMPAQNAANYGDSVCFFRHFRGASLRFPTSADVRY
jgi:hypothetical protein